MKPFEDEDPMELQAVIVAEGDLEAQARFIIKEFCSMGMPKDHVFDLFRNPFYLGTYHLYQRLGEEKISYLINECTIGVFEPKVVR